MGRPARKIIVKDSTGRKIIEQSRIRLLCVGLFFMLCFGSICARMIEVSVIDNPEALTITVIDLDREDTTGEEVAIDSLEPRLARGNITDRNGMLVATSLMTASVFANPREVSNAEEAADKLGKVLRMDSKGLLKRLRGDKSFVWLKRNLTPKEQQTINNLGIPGIYFYPEERRVYPYGNLLAHVLGFVGVDNRGLAGIEKTFDRHLRDTGTGSQSLALSIDVRLQAVLREEMQKAIQQFSAIGGAGVILDLRSDELLSLVSLPDFDPHKPGSASADTRFNRASLGAYEMGSTFKSFTMAMALETGTAHMKSVYDTTHPLKISGFNITDSHPERRPLTLPEIYAYSSNIGTAKVALDVGTRKQRAFMKAMGMLDPIDIELPEKATPLYPGEWKEINTVTISYGHGISVSPLHLVRGIAALADGGTLPRLTLIKDSNKNKPPGERVVSEQTSQNMRRLFRLVVEHGTASKADVPGYRVGGKTGTAEKVSASGRYSAKDKMASFVGVFPVDDPRYVILVMIDQPRGDKSTFGFATGGWISAPVVNQVISRMGPMLALKPKFDTPGDDAKKFWVERPKPKAPAIIPATATYVHDASF